MVADESGSAVDDPDVVTLELMARVPAPGRGTATVNSVCVVYAGGHYSDPKNPLAIF